MSTFPHIRLSQPSDTGLYTYDPVDFDAYEDAHKMLDINTLRPPGLDSDATSNEYGQSSLLEATGSRDPNDAYVRSGTEPLLISPNRSESHKQAGAPRRKGGFQESKVSTGLAHGNHSLCRNRRHSIHNRLASLLIVSATLHWPVSESLFLAKVISYDTNGQEDPTGSVSSIGYSCTAIITVIFLGAVVILLGLLNGFRWEQGMPLAGKYSAAINVATKSVMWGVVSSDNGVGHCCFTSFEKPPPVYGRL